MTDHLREDATDSEIILRGTFLLAKRDRVRLPGGEFASREYIVHPGAVAVVPLLDDGRVVLERQYRHPVAQVMIEFPAGKLDGGETPLACGQRELQEETGYTATEWARAGAMHLAVAYSTEIIHIYFARGLKPGSRQLDSGEFLDVFTATQAQLFQWCLDGKVTDAKTLACAFWLQSVGAGQRELDWRRP